MDKDSAAEEKRNADPFASFLFGPTKKKEINEERIEESSQEPDLNYVEIMVHLDTLMESVNNLKPLFMKFQPYISQFLSKKQE